MRILYVEDNETNQALVERVCRGKQHTVLFRDEGEGALELLAADPDIDLILLDIELAGSFSGLEVVAALRERNDKRPVVAVTAYAMMGDRERFLEAGCDQYLPKPLVIPDLLAIMDHYEVEFAKKDGAKPAAAATPASPPPAAEEAKPAAAATPASPPPAEEAKPAAAATPASPPPAAEEAKPAVATAPASPPPAEEVKPVVAAIPVSPPPAVEEAKPATPAAAPASPPVAQSPAVEAKPVPEKSSVTAVPIKQPESERSAEE